MNVHQHHVDKIDRWAAEFSMNRNQFLKQLIEEMTDRDVDEIIARRL